jgi:predicted PurR-regulated permease PerM
MPSHAQFAKRSLIAAAIAVFVVSLAAAAWVVSDVVLLAFFGALLALILHAIAAFVQRWTGMPTQWAVVLVSCVLAALALAGVYFLAAEASRQFDELSASVSSAWNNAVALIGNYRWSEKLLNSTLPADAFAGRIGGAFTSTLSGVGYLVVVVFIGFYGALEPEMYRAGLLRLVPLSSRHRAEEVLESVTRTLKRWLLGRLANMAIVGLLVGAGLWILGVPFVVPLAIIAFLADFVPYLGPIISAVPAILLGLGAEGGPRTAAYVAVLYFAVQSAESYLIQPLIQRRAVEMPPALLLAAQLASGFLFGVVGVVVATPLVVVVLVLVKMLYVEDVIGDTNAAVGADGGG